MAQTNNPNRGPDHIRALRTRARDTIRRLRDEYTVEELADVLDVSKGSVWRWEHNKALPFRRMAEHIHRNEASITRALKANRRA